MECITLGRHLIGRCCLLHTVTLNPGLHCLLASILFISCLNPDLIMELEIIKNMMLLEHPLGAGKHLMKYKLYLDIHLLLVVLAIVGIVL